MVRTGGYKEPIDPRKLLTFLLKGGWFRERSGMVSAHPSILEGLELLLDREPGLTEDVLAALLEGLAKQNRGDVAHRVCKNLEGRHRQIPELVQRVIDEYLLDRLRTASGYGFGQAFAEAASECRSAEPLAVLARGLRSDKSPNGMFEFLEWNPPALDTNDIQRISQSADARQFASKFVRELAVGDAFSPYGAKTLRSFFGQFGWDSTEDFVRAVEKGLEAGNVNVDVAVEGTLDGEHPPFDRVIDAALSDYDAASKWWEEFQETYRQARQAEIDADYASHIEEQPSERFAPSKNALKKAVEIRIKRESFEWILRHPRLPDLLEAWGDAVTTASTTEELSALAEACDASHANILYEAASKAKNKEFMPNVVNRLLTDVHHASDGMNALMRVLDSDEIAKVFEVGHGLPLIVRLELADSVNVRAGDGDGDEEKADRIVSSLLSAEEQQVWRAYCARHIDENELPVAFNDSLRDGLRLVAAEAKSEYLGVRAVFRLAKCGEDIAPYLPRLLASESMEVRVNALRMLADNTNPESRKVLLKALSDKDYHCRREAMFALARTASPNEVAAILAMASDRSAPVREACAGIIRKHQWAGAQPVLCELLNDRRSAQHGVGIIIGQLPNFHVAIAAVHALDSLTEELSGATIKSVEAFLHQRNPKGDDPFVHYYALQLLSSVKTEGVLGLLAEFLSDDWHVSGMKDEGFPLRYVAAWGLAAHLLDDPSVAENLRIGALFDAAIHHDPRQAGPALICLGLAGHHASGEILRLCRSTDPTADRLALITLSIALGASSASKELLAALGNHPISAIIEFAKATPPPDETAWNQFCVDNPPIGEWIAKIQSSDDVNPALRFALHLLFGRRIKGNLAQDDLRANELPESLPVMNLRTMTGGE